MALGGSAVRVGEHARHIRARQTARLGEPHIPDLVTEIAGDALLADPFDLRGIDAVGCVDRRCWRVAGAAIALGRREVELVAGSVVGLTSVGWQRRPPIVAAAEKARRRTPIPLQVGAGVHRQEARVLERSGVRVGLPFLERQETGGIRMAVLAVVLLACRGEGAHPGVVEMVVIVECNELELHRIAPGRDILEGDDEVARRPGGEHDRIVRRQVVEAEMPRGVGDKELLSGA